MPIERTVYVDRVVEVEVIKLIELPVENVLSSGGNGRVVSNKIDLRQKLVELPIEVQIIT
mgnify:FL=1